MPFRQMHTAFISVGLVALLAVLLVTGPALAQGRWSQMKPIPQGEATGVGCLPSPKVSTTRASPPSATRST